MSWIESWAMEKASYAEETSWRTLLPKFFSNAKFLLFLTTCWTTKIQYMLFIIEKVCMEKLVLKPCSSKWVCVLFQSYQTKEYVEMNGKYCLRWTLKWLTSLSLFWFVSYWKKRQDDNGLSGATMLSSQNIFFSKKNLPEHIQKNCFCSTYHTLCRYVLNLNWRNTVNCMLNVLSLNKKVTEQVFPWKHSQSILI